MFGTVFCARNRRFALLLPLLAGLSFSSCNKKATQKSSDHPVPSVPVNITMYPGDPLNFNIQAIGGWKYISGGVRGIIVYRKSEEEFVALERASPQLPNDPGALGIVQKDNFTVKDTISGSQWRIIDGAVSKGPATWPLRLYGTSYDGNSLVIRN